TAIDGQRENAVAIVDHESVRSVPGHARAELLHRPFRCWMVGGVPIHDPARADIEDDEDVYEPEGRGDRDKEIAPQHLARVIPHEARPRLRPRSTTRGTRAPHVAPNGPRRHRDSELEPQF